MVLADEGVHEDKARVGRHVEERIRSKALTVERYRALIQRSLMQRKKLVLKTSLGGSKVDVAAIKHAWWIDLRYEVAESFKALPGRIVIALFENGLGLNHHI